jgi:tetratricopeptide (TPR) repeat protein
MGRLNEVDTMLADLVTAAPQVPAWRAAQAVADIELRRLDAAASIVDFFTGDGFASLPRDWLWLAAVGHLADCCADLALLGSARPEAAAVLYRLLEPYRDRCVVLAHGVLCDGAAARQLGALATVLGRHDEAAAHFETAIAINRAQGAAPWLARAQLGYGDLLVRRCHPGDLDRAIALRDEAAATIEAIGARGIDWRVRELANRLP